MNLLKRNWIKAKNRKILLNKKKDCFEIQNNTDKSAFIVIPSFFRFSENSVAIDFKGDLTKGDGCSFCMFSLRKHSIADISLDKSAIIEKNNIKGFFAAIKILPNSTVLIKEVKISFKSVSVNDFIKEELTHDTLIISPSYPSVENRHICGAVHARIKAYLKQDLKFDLICTHDCQNAEKYNFDDVHVLKMPFSALRYVLQTQKYKKILVHFFDGKYDNVFKACDLRDTPLYFWTHAPGTLYLDYIKKNDKMLKRYNENPNVTWLFASDGSFEKTIQKEIDLINENTRAEIPRISPQGNNIVLSVVVPAYNVSQYIEACVKSMLYQENEDKLEIIVVNDGSRDNTREVVAKMIEDICDSAAPVVRLVDKENGGHGSAINTGIREARGKYIKIVDGDDHINTEDFCKLIGVLLAETSDIVLTDYSKDMAISNAVEKQMLYGFMRDGLQYKLVDLCSGSCGFGEWGPVLATSSYKSEILKQIPNLSEKCFYVDMEFNMYVFAYSSTVSYYPLNIYNYYIGRIDQSISKNAYIRNFKDHEKVLTKIVAFVHEHPSLEPQTRNYLIEKLALPMYSAHMVILVDFLKKSTNIKQFRKVMQAYESTISMNRLSRRFRFYLKTNGHWLWLDPLIRRLKKAA